MYLHVVLFLSWLLLAQPTLGTTPNYTANATAVTNSAFFQAKPNCTLTCGNLTVPYPFGIGVGLNCSIDPQFDITCDTSSGPPKAFIGDTNLEILSISQTQVRIRNYFATACYNNGTWPRDTRTKLGDQATPYTFSDVANKFTVVGCDDYAWIQWSFQGLNLYIGCMSKCDNSTDGVPGSGYCQIDIPKGLRLTTYNTSLRSFQAHSEVMSFNPCGYAFLGEQNSFEFNRETDLLDPNFANRIMDTVPRVLDYAVGRNKNCTETQNSNTSLCQDNASCNDTVSSYGGYLCSCNEGYEGNPYLSHGCTDIDECEDSNLNDCDKVKGKCTNTPGSFKCECNPLYYGDGKVCTAKASQFSVIKLSLESIV